LAEGGVVFFGGRRYRLAKEGSIDFVNATQIEPDLDLEAVTRAGGAEITLTLKGTPTTLETSLSSDNPQYSQDDLVSLLVTGKTAADSAAGGYMVGSQELLGYLSGELFGAAGRAVGLDTLRVEQGTPDVRYDAGLVAGETDPGARLTFGKNIGRKAQVVFSQSLQNSGGITWIVSYAPRSNIELRAVSLDSGDRLYGFRHDLVFGASTPASTRTPPPAPPAVTKVQIIGAGPDEAALRSLLKLRAGDRFSFFQWQDDRDRLELFYQRQDRATARVTTRRTAADTPDSRGAEIAYEVRPGPRTTVVVQGASFPKHVIEAMSRIPEHAYQLEIAGDGPQRAQLEQQARDLRVPTRFHGWLPRRPLCRLFERSRIFVLASMSDNFPVSLLEAMAAGCAIVTTSAGGCPEVVGDTGLVVEPGDVGALHQALTSLIRQPARAEELGRRAVQRVRDLFSWPAVASRHEAAYEPALRRIRTSDQVPAPV
jgi:hypothetical protein